MDLPQELLLQVFSFVSILPSSQKTLASCCLVCRKWRSAAAEYLYKAPYITQRNFRLFARTIAGGPGGRRRSESGKELGKLVRRFSMADLVHETSNSLTARLLGYMKQGLERFTAPALTLS